jgi:membrane protease YdiL (CAAX protease family)
MPPAPETRRDALGWLLLGVVGYVIGQVAALVLIAGAADAAGQGNRLGAIARMAAPPSWYVAASLVGLWVGFFAGPWLASRTRGTRHLVADVGLRFRPADAVGVLVGIGGQLLVTLVYLPFASHLRNFNAPTTKLTGAAHGGSFAAVAILTVVGAPFFEELFFRGLLFRALLRLFESSRYRAAGRAAGLVGAVVADGLLFGLAHGELEQLGGLALFGAILAFVYYRTRRLGTTIVSHATFNLVAVLAVESSRAGLIH